MTKESKRLSAPRLVWSSANALLPWLGPAFLLAIFATIEITLPMPLFLLRSGFFVFYASELAVGAGIVAAIILFIRKKYRISPFMRTALIAMAFFLAWYCVVTAVRIFMGDNWSQSVLTLRTTVLPLFVLLMMDMGIEKGRRCMLGLCMYNFVICAVELGFAIFSEVRMSPFMGNLMVFTCAAVLLIPANFFCLDLSLRGRCPKAFSVITLFNLFCVIVLPFLGGARSTVAVSLMGVMISFIIFFGRRAVRKRVFAVIAASVTVVFAFWVLNFGGKSVNGLYRVLPTPAAVAAELGIEGYERLPGGDNYVRIGSKGSPGKGSANSDSKQIATTQSEKAQSDIDRGYLWQQSLESIMRSPIIGEGIIYFAINSTYDIQTQAAHNFVLEHINAFGGIGFLFWLAIFLVPLWQIFKSGGWRKRSKPKLCLACAVLMMAVQSLFQPTMMIVPTVTLLWLVIASWKSVIAGGGAGHE